MPHNTIAVSCAAAVLLAASAPAPASDALPPLDDDARVEALQALRQEPSRWGGAAAAPGTEPRVADSPLIAAHFLLYDMNGKYGAEYALNSSPALGDTVVRVFASDGTPEGVAYGWRENWGSLTNGAPGDGYYVEFSSAQSPTVAGYWAAQYALPGTSNFPIWLVPVDGEAVGMRFGGGDWSSNFPPSFEFTAASIRPMIAQQGPGATYGQYNGAFYDSEPPVTVRVDYLEGNAVHGRQPDELETTFNDGVLAMWWGDPDQGVYMGDFLPYGPIRITCSVDGMESGSVEVDMQRNHYWISRPVIFENPDSLDDSMFHLPSVTPLPQPPFPTAPDAMPTGAMLLTTSGVEDWRGLEE